MTGVNDDSALLALLGKGAGGGAPAGPGTGLRRAQSDRTLGQRSGVPPPAGPQRRGVTMHGRKPSSGAGSTDSDNSRGSLHSAPDLSLQRRGRQAAGGGAVGGGPRQQRPGDTAPSNVYMNGNGIAAAKTRERRALPGQVGSPRAVRPPGPPLTAQGSYDRARQLATTSNRWLLVYVYSEGDADAQRMNQETWTDPLLKDIVGGSYVFWAGSSSEEEGCRACTMNRLKRVPATFLLDPYSGKIAHVLYGFVSAVNLGRLLTNFGQKQPTAPRAGAAPAAGGAATRQPSSAPPASPPREVRARDVPPHSPRARPAAEVGGGKSPRMSMDDLTVPSTSTVRYERKNGGTFEYRVVPASEMPSQLEMLRAIFGEHAASSIPKGEYGKDWGPKGKKGGRVLKKPRAAPQSAAVSVGPEPPRETSLKVRADGKLYPSSFPPNAQVSELFDHCFEAVPQADSRAFTLKHIAAAIRDLADEEDATILDAGLDQKTVILSWLD